MKQKLIILAGMTASGKTKIAQQLAKQLNTRITIGDSLQMYKNWKISSGWPDPLDNYDLVGRFDAATERIAASDFKRLVQTEADNQLIEGGCSFYLNYLLNSGPEQFTEEEIQTADQCATQLLENATDGQAVIREHCPTYQNAIAIVDKYRMIKALRYALLTNGTHYRNPSMNGDTFAQSRDVRGYFLYATPEILSQRIQLRCDQMINDGVIAEFNKFYQQNLTDYQNKTVPIGFYPFVKLLKKRKEGIEYVSSQKIKEIKRKMAIDFMDEFYIANRQYAAVQRKYFKTHHKHFIWIDAQQNPINIIEKTLNMTEKEFINYAESDDQFYHRRRKDFKMKRGTKDSEPSELIVAKLLNQLDELKI